MAKKKVSKRVLAFRKGLTEHFKGNPPDFDFSPLTSDLDKAPKLLVDIKKQKKMESMNKVVKENNLKELVVMFTPILLILWLFLGISNGFWTTFKCMVLAVLCTWLIVKWVEYVINLEIK